MISTIKITSKRQATLPVALCNQLGIKPGDRLLLDSRQIEGKRMWIVSIPEKAKTKWFGSLRKYSKGKKHGMDSIRKSIAVKLAKERD
ncbi:MAG: hypothetical protein A2X48_04725 [Lentisphaerae bacterium GWF2_49_21]|nr:MAG: hypothetical protein A2X48_04725 [Lentisphaerae bacterium GWF2_49_21]